MPYPSPAPTPDGSASPEPLRILLLSLRKPYWFDKSFATMLERLKALGTLHQASATDLAFSCLRGKPDVVIVTDSGIINPEHTIVLKELVSYVLHGGSVVFGCLFSKFITSADMDHFFGRYWSLPWRYGTQDRETVVEINETFMKQNSWRGYILSSPAVNAVFLKHVDTRSAFFLPSRTSPQNWLVYPSKPVVPFDQTPVAFTLRGLGWLGYVGTVDECDHGGFVVMAVQYVCRRRAVHRAVHRL